MARKVPVASETPSNVPCAIFMKRNDAGLLPYLTDRRGFPWATSTAED
jgi:hypothetical protein